MHTNQLLNFIKRVVFCTKRTPHRTCLFERYFSVHHVLRSPKKKTSLLYSSVDSGRYSSLVKSVVSTRVSSQTPESIDAENSHVYGPVVKSHTRISKVKVPKHVHPFLNCDDGAHGREFLGPPARISLQRDGKSSVPSVTRVLQDTLSPLQRFYLERWKRRMITELGEEGFKEYTLNLFRQGGLFHNAVENILTQDATAAETKPDVIPGSYPNEIEGYMESIGYILEDISGVRAIESTVHHGTLDYRGIVDCVARYRGVLCVIEWKTSEKPKPHLSHTYDNPLQVAAYAGALNGDNNYKYQVEQGLIVVAYKDGSPGHAHPLNSTQMLDYWERWLVRLEEYMEIKSR